MPATRILARLALAVAAAVTALVSVTVGAQPAQAANDPVTVRLTGVSSRQIVGRSDTITLTLRNETKTDYPGVSRIFAIQLGGLTGDGVRMSRGGVTLTSAGSSNGQVIMTDPEQVPLAAKGARGASGTWQYQIDFTPSAPNGKAVLGFAVYGNGQQLGSAIVNISVQNNGGQPSPTITTHPTSPATTTPSSAPTQTAPAATAGGPSANQGTGQTLDPLPAGKSSGGSSSGVPILFYVFGVALLGAGGTILWLLVRRPATDLDDAYPTGSAFPFGGDYPSGGYPAASDGNLVDGGYQPVQKPPRYGSPAAQLGYPATPLTPTALLPQVGGAQSGHVHLIGLGTPTDPWAGLPGADPTERIDLIDPADLTRDFGAGPIGPAH